MILTVQRPKSSEIGTVEPYKGWHKLSRKQLTAYIKNPVIFKQVISLLGIYLINT